MSSLIQGLKSAIKAPARALLNSEPVIAGKAKRDAKTVHQRVSESSGRPRDTHVLFASTGGDNIGDQAMLESFVRNVAGKKAVVLRDTNGYDLSFLDETFETEIIELRHLIFGRGHRHNDDVASLGPLFAAAKSVSFIGADIMDGGYNEIASIKTWDLAALSANLGIDTRMLGFSWKMRSSSRVNDAIRRAAMAGVKLFTRDPHSTLRVAAITGPEHGPVDAADIVFSLGGDSPETEHNTTVEQLRAQGSRIAVLNMSGLIQARFDQIPAYEEILSALVKSGFTIVLLPHVSHPGADDIDALRQLRSRSEIAASAHFVDSLLSPLQVRALVSHASVVITGRMHLSILALAQQIPAIVLSTQGKVGGLVELVGIPELCVEPDNSLASSVLETLSYLEQHADTVSETFRQSHPEIMKRSRMNFDGLDAIDAPHALPAS